MRDPSGPVPLQRRKIRERPAGRIGRASFSQYHQDIKTGEHLPAVRLFSLTAGIFRREIMSYIRPAALVVVSNIFYQRYTKSVPKEMDAMSSMIVTYLVGAVTSAVMFFAMNRGGNLFQAYSRMNAAPVLTGGGADLRLSSRVASQHGLHRAERISRPGGCGNGSLPRGNHIQQGNRHRHLPHWSVLHKSVTGKIGLTASAAGKNHR